MKNTFTDLLFPKRPPFTRIHIWALIMRISQVYFLMMTSVMIAAASPPGNGQSIETTVVSLEITNEPLRKVFQKIESQTDFLFAWNKKVNDYGRVTLVKGNYTVKTALDIVLKETGLKYEQDEKYILVTPVGRTESVMEEAEVKNGGDVVEVYPAALVTGTVRDASTQEPLAGVNIIVKGTTKGATTDFEGRFAVEANSTDVLVFTFIGYKTYETQVDGRAVINVVLEGDTRQLQEVEINAGYYKVKDSEQTGSIAKINAEEIQKQPVGNTLAALQGQLPGMTIIQQTGVPGGNFQVRIRGQNSITSGKDPLFIIDGVPFISEAVGIRNTSGRLFPTGLSPLNSINPADIESVEILKDADATAIYGSRGSNGVILITTKNGKAGTSRINLNFYRGVGEVTRLMELLNTEDYIEMRTEAYANDGVASFPPEAYDINGTWDQNRHTDWQETLIGGTAQITDGQVSLSGGTENIQYVLSGGYRRETSVFYFGGSDQRASGHFKLNNTSNNDKLKLSFSINYALNWADLINEDITLQAALTPPNAPKPFDETGNLNWENNTFENPLAYTKRKFKSNLNNLITNALVSYSLFPNFEIKANLGYANRADKATSKFPLSSRNPSYRAFFQNATDFSNSSFRSFLIEPQASWSKSTGELKVNVLIGSTFQNQITEALGQTAYGFASEALMDNILSATRINVGTDMNAQYKYSAIFGRINLNWKEKYLLNLTGRRDGSSRFGPSNQFGNFGAIGVAWLFTKEKFLRNISTLSFGKLRMSYGTTGNDQIGDYQFLDTYNSAGLYHGVAGLEPTRVFNPNFAWEINKKLEVAFELGLIDDRIFISTNYYHNRSSNQLTGTSLPPTAGFPNFISNRDATVQNTGFEVEINTLTIRSRNFSWRTAANITVPQNKLISYPNLESSPDASRFVIGKPLNIIKVFNYLGVNSETGVYEFEDVNGDAQFSVQDQVVVKELGPVLYGGISNTFQFRGLQLSILLQFVKQSSLNYLNAFGTTPPGFLFNQPSIVVGRWQQPGDVTNVMKYTQDFALFDAFYRASQSELVVSDASFMRLKNVSLSYDLPRKWLNKLSLGNMRFFIQGQNLLTVTKFDGTDPESSDASKLPPLRMLTGGFNITL